MRVKNPPALRPTSRPVWSMEEIAGVVVKARGLQVHAAGVLAGFSGLRAGEVSGLLWSDLDLQRGFVTVSRTVEEDEDGTLLEYPPTNGKARVVPLTFLACEELLALLTTRKEYRLAKGGAWNEAGRVVPKKDGTQMAPSSLKSQWWNWVARQKIDPHLPIHGLRDSFDTWVYEEYGVKQAQEWLGHSDPSKRFRSGGTPGLVASNIDGRQMRGADSSSHTQWTLPAPLASSTGSFCAHCAIRSQPLIIASPRNLHMADQQGSIRGWFVVKA